MAIVKRFEDLECWQEARKFVQSVYTLTKKDNFSKDHKLVGQITNSAVSSMANIAEGFHRKSYNDFIRFMDYSRASIAETFSHCYVALDQKYITSKELDSVKAKGEVAWEKINSFISYLNRSEKWNTD